jgi:flagellar hook-length control protein FliK
MAPLAAANAVASPAIATAIAPPARTDGTMVLADAPAGAPAPSAEVATPDKAPAAPAASPAGAFGAAIAGQSASPSPPPAPPASPKGAARAERSAAAPATSAAPAPDPTIADDQPVATASTPPVAPAAPQSAPTQRDTGPTDGELRHASPAPSDAEAATGPTTTAPPAVAATTGNATLSANSLQSFHRADPAAAATPVAQPAQPSGASPADQVSPVLVSLGRSQGTQQVTVRLDPPELGRLQIRLEQPTDGPARVVLTAERPQTLDLVARDQVRLHRALDQAGVPADGRTVTFRLQPSTASNAAATTALPGAQTAGTPTGDGGGSADRGARRSTPVSAEPSPADANHAEDDTPQTVRWLRAGIDITA